MKLANIGRKVFKTTRFMVQILDRFFHRLGQLFGWLFAKIPIKIPSRNRPVILIIAGLIILYLLGGALTSFEIYKNHRRSAYIIGLLRIYPLPVAIVDGQYITVLESYRQIGYIEHFSQKTNQNVGTPDEMRQKVNDRLIEKAMVTKIAKQTRLRVSEKEITEALEKVYQDNGGEKPVAEVLQSLYGMTIPEFKKLIREQLIKQKVKEHALTRVQVRHIVIRDESKAKEVLEKVKNNENFDELAKQFSEDIGSRDKGGQLGFVNRGQLPKEVEDVAFTKKAGETHPDLVKSQFGFHIVRVEARNEGTIDLTYDDLIKQFKEKKRIIRFLK